MATQALFNVTRLREFMDLYKIDSATLARGSGLSKGTISKLLNGVNRNPGPKVYRLLGEYFTVPPDTFMVLLDPNWRSISWDNDKVINELFWIGAKGKTLLSLTPQFTTYMVPAELSHAVQGTRPNASHLPYTLQPFGGLQWQMEHRKRKLESRIKNDYLLKVITRADTAHYAAKTGRRDALDQMAGAITKDWEHTALGFVNDAGWKVIDNLVRQEVVDSDWSNINVTDDILACVYTDGVIYYSLHKGRVREVRSLLENRCAQQVAYPFPTQSSETVAQLAKCKTGAIKYFDSAWRHRP